MIDSEPTLKPKRLTTLILSSAMSINCFVLAADASACISSAVFAANGAEVLYDPFRVNAQRSGQFGVTFTLSAPGSGQPRVASIDYQLLDIDSVTQPQLGTNGAQVEILRQNKSVLLAKPAPDFADQSNFNTVNVPNASLVVSSIVGQLSVEGRQDIPAGLQSEAFDLAYRCNFSDGSTTVGIRPAGLLASVNTQFLVRATVVGGGTSRTLEIDPAVRATSGAMAIRSTGPYNLAIASENGMRMVPNNGGNGASIPSNQIIPYKVRIDGEDIDQNSSPKVCGRSGLNGAVVRVATRVANGVNLSEIRAGTYSDVLTVTVTPDVSASSGTANCGS
jgi:hypothetical protein